MSNKYQSSVIAYYTRSQVYSVAGYHITSQACTKPGVKYIMYSFLVCEDNEHLSVV